MDEKAVAEEFVPLPTSGRTFEEIEIVRIDACDPTGRMRLDGMVRAMQNVSADDTADSGHGGQGWVVRRTVVAVDQVPKYREKLTLTTFCGGLGRSWAERRVVVRGDAGASFDGKALWVHIDPVVGRPIPLEQRFLDVYGEAAAGRKVRARLHHPKPPADADWQPYRFRFTDADMWGHVNNAAYWEATEDILERADNRPPATGLFSMDHGPAIDPDEPVEVAVTPVDDARYVWWRVGSEVRASFRSPLR